MNSIPDGYKMSEIGVIPEDWELAPLSKLVHPDRPITYGIVQTGEPVLNGVPCVRVIDMTNGKLAVDKMITTSLDISNSYRRTILQLNDLMIALRGEIGEVAKVSPELVGANLTRGVAIIAPRDEIIPDYLLYALSSSLVKEEIKDQVTGSALREIPIGGLRKVRVPFPPTKDEQRAIADALIDIDAQIAMLDEIIAKKWDIRQGTMQCLLTGKGRLVGFSDEWEVKSLGELFEFKNGLNKSKSFFGYGTPIVNYTDVYKKRGLTATDIAGKVSVTKSELTTYSVQKGDVFFTRTSETVDEIGLTSVICGDVFDTVFSGFLLRARPKDDSLCIDFKKYCFSNSEIRNSITATSSYTTRALTNGKLLSQIKIRVPSPIEQQAIADILSDMDAEISELEEKREKTIAFKQGMMQELLTGNTRLI